MLQKFRKLALLGDDLGLLLFDVLAVAVFVLIGRRTHDEGSAIFGVLKTAAPFLIALVIGWFLSGALQNPVAGKSGLGTWAVTWGLGLLLRRVVFRSGTALPFVIVAGVFLFVTLVVWRFLLWRKIEARKRATTSGNTGNTKSTGNTKKRSGNA